jgi:exosortase
MNINCPVSRKRLSGIQILQIAVLVSTFILAYFPVWRRLVTAWQSSDEYSHGFLIVPICIYLLYWKKEVLTKIAVRSSLWGLGLVIFSLLLYLFAHFAEIQTAAALSMVLLLTGIIIYFYGFLMFKELLFPLFLLLLMIPVPAQIYSSLTIPLQLFVSEASVWLVSYLGVPVYREGNVIHLPEQTLQVVQACSGLRSLISVLTVCAIFGYLTLESNILRSLLFFSGIPAAILANIVRVLLTVLAFYYFNYDLTKGTTHTVFGMGIFIIAFIIIAITKGLLSNWEKSATQK